jgi:type IV pilus assembly protein PilO
MKFQNKINDVLEKIDDRQRYWIFAGILLFVFLLDYVILMRPQLAALSRIIPEIGILRDDLRLAQDNIEKRDFYREEVGKLDAGVEAVHRRLRPRERVPLILEFISRAADENGVTVDQMMPLAEGQEELLSVQGRGYFSLPLKIQARGGYHDFGRFVGRLESGDIFLNLESFSVISSEGPGPHAIQLVLTAVIYDG